MGLFQHGGALVWPFDAFPSCSSLGTCRASSDLNPSTVLGGKWDSAKRPHFTNEKPEREAICPKPAASLRHSRHLVCHRISIFVRTQGSEMGNDLPKVTLERVNVKVGMQVQLRLTRLLSLQLVKTAELDPSRNYLAGIHPHGVLAAGIFINMCTESSGFSELFPGIRPHLMMLNLWFWAPFFRDYLMAAGESSPPG